MMRPYAGETVGLQLDPHLDAVGLYLVAGGALLGLHLRQDAEKVLHMMTYLMRDHVGVGEFAGLATAAFETHAHIVEKRGVEIDAPVSYTHLRAHETVLDLVCRLLLEKKKY